MNSDDSTSWHRARLIPTTGIGGTRGQEMRATSVLLSVLGAVPDFASSVLRQLGAPAGKVETYVEVEFDLPDGSTVRPDGLIRVSRGKRCWTCLVEVKTGRNLLDREQLENYLDVARINGFDALVTISNQFSPAAGVHPVTVSGSKTRRVAFHHLSWIAIITAAVIQHDHHGVSDPDQAWILEELIKYLEHPDSGALRFEDLGQHWVNIRNSARDGTLRKSDPGVGEVVGRWIEFMRFLSLQLGKELGAEVRQVLSNNERSDQLFRVNSLKRTLESDRTLQGAFRIPGAIADLHISVNLARRMVEASVTVDAPKAGRPRTRVNWLVRQLSDAPDSTRIDARFGRRSDTSSNTLGALRQNPALGLLSDNSVNPSRLTVTFISDMGIKKGNGQGSFVKSVQHTVESFYREVVQVLSPWQPPAPKLPLPDETPAP